MKEVLKKVYASILIITIFFPIIGSTVLLAYDEKNELDSQSSIQEELDDEIINDEEKAENFMQADVDTESDIQDELTYQEDTKEILTPTDNTSQQLIEDGIYVIRSALDNNLVMEVANGDESDEANIQLGNFDSALNQKFNVKYVNGYYEIYAMHSGKVLEVDNEENNSVLNVQQFEFDNSDAQKWIIQDVGNGYYNIISKSNGLRIDVYNALAVNGSNIQVSLGVDENEAQMFKFEKEEQVQDYKDELMYQNAELEEVEEVQALETIDNTSQQLIEDGTYILRSALNNNLVIEVANAGKNNGANVQLGSYVPTINQEFNVKYVNGYYEIYAVHSGKSLDVYNAGKNNGTNIQQCEFTNNDAQKWIIQEAGDGYYNIISKCNELKLDVYNASARVGTNIQVCSGGYGNKAQMFSFEKVEPLESKQTIEDGTYILRSALNNNLVIEVANAGQNNGDNVQLGSYAPTINQEFNVRYVNGYYEIYAVHSGKSLDVYNAGKNNGTNIQQCEFTNNDAQKWIIQEAGDGYYNIISKCNELKLDVYNASARVGTNIQVCSGGYGNKAQMFSFEKVEPLESKQTIEDGTYILRSALNNNLVIEIANAARSNGANVQLGSYAPTINQKFNVKYINGYYEIYAVHSGKSLDVYNAGKNNGTNIQQCEFTNNDAQKWIIQEAGDGYYNIISKCNELKLDVYNASARVGTNIQVCSGGYGNKAQMFSFEKVEPLESKQTIENGTYYIQSALNNSFVIEIANAGILNGDNAQLLLNDYRVNKRFYVEYMESGYYKIVATHSNKVLDVRNAGLLNGTNIQQCEFTNNDAQKWIIQEAGDGYYNIISKCNELYMDVEQGLAKSGSNIQCCQGGKNNKAQMFKFVKATDRKGIDVSEWQGSINWSDVKKSGKVDFAVIRAGYRGWGTDGTLVEDKKLKANVDGAKENGIDIGLYFFTQAKNTQEAVEEANYVINLVKKYNISLAYPIYIDTEESTAYTVGKIGRADNLDVNTRTQVCKAFIQTVQNAGYKGGVYASNNWFKNNLIVSELEFGEIWLAEWNYDPSSNPKYDRVYQMWQYSNIGSILGINGNVDLNLYRY